MEKWGFREAARHLGCSWRFAQKEADGGVLAACVLPESDFAHEQVLMYRKHYQRSPLGVVRYTHTTEDMSVNEDGTPKLVLKCLDADKVRAITPEGFQQMLKERELQGVA